MTQNILAKKNKAIFYQIIGLGSGFLAVLLFLGINLYPKLFLIWNAASDKLEAACGCANHLSFSSHPFFFGVLSIAGFFLSAFLIFSVLRIAKIRKSTSRFIESSLERKRRKISPKLRKAAEGLDLENRLTEIKSQSPIVFCSGFLKSRVFVSSKLVKVLDREELAAVLRHEQYHLLAHEPLKLFAVKALAKVLFFAPGIGLLAKQYSIFSELAADEWATAGFERKTSLSRALDKIIAFKENIVVSQGLAIPFSEATEERINKLLDNQYLPNSKFPFSAIVFTVFALVLSLFSFKTAFSYSNEFLGKGQAAIPCLDGKINSQSKCQIFPQGFLDNMQRDAAECSHATCGK